MRAQRRKHLREPRAFDDRNLMQINLARDELRKQRQRGRPGDQLILASAHARRVAREARVDAE